MLTELAFSDIYVRIDADASALYRPIDAGTRTIGMGIIKVPDSYQRDVQELRKLVIEKNADEGSLTFQGIPLRMSRQHMANGEIWASMRRVRVKIPTLEELHVNPLLLEPLRMLGKRRGLILFVGATGAGKTTTATALLADFLNRYGNLAYTIEDPVEYRLQGSHGKSGYCYQVEVRDDDEWAPALKTALRWHPTYIFVGEVRTPAAAKQMLRAATSGHLVLATIHAGSIEEGLYAIIQTAQSELGPMAQNLAADGLIAVIHQALTPLGPRMSILMTEEGLGDPVRACIRDNHIGMVTTYLHQQAARLGAVGTSIFSPVRPAAHHGDSGREMYGTARKPETDK